MQTEITGHHIEITEALRRHINKRLERLNERQDKMLSHVHVVLQVSKNSHQCDIMTRHEHEEFVAHNADDDMYVAIDRATDKMERQLHDAKGRKLSRRTTSAHN